MRTLHLSLLALAALSMATPLSAADRPNVLLVLADDLGYGDVGCYNPESKIPTPAFDRLAAEGVRFTDAYSAAAVCVPSRYGLLTGRYPFRGDLNWRKQPTIDEGRATIASLLKSAGYATACVGKWHCGFDGGTDGHENRALTGGPLDRGFDHFFGQHGSLDQPPYFYIRDRQAVQPATETTPGSEEEGFPVPYQGRFWRAGKIAPNFDHEEVLDRYAAEAQAFLKAHAEKASAEPFFLYVPLTAPHGPWLPGPKFRGKSDAGPLGDFVVHVDDVLRRLVEQLDQLDLADDTLVIVGSDNGSLWFPENVKRWGHDSSGGLRGRKGDAWEGGSREPLIVRWPGHVPAGKTSDRIVGLIDLLPTLAAVVGAEAPHEIDGTSFLPAMLDPQTDEPLREAILLQCTGGGKLAIRVGDWKLIPWLGSGGFLTKPSVVKPGPDDPPGQLYHLAEDPGEQNNVYADHPEIVARLTKRLEEIRRGDAGGN